MKSSVNRNGNKSGRFRGARNAFKHSFFDLFLVFTIFTLTFRKKDKMLVLQ